MSNYDSLWAKDDGESLLEHTLKVISVAKSICNNLPLPKEEIEELLPQLLIACTFHDIGKSADGFQEALRTKKAWGYRHEILSTAAANGVCSDISKDCLFAILTHHRCIPPSIFSTNEKTLPFEELPPFDGCANPRWNNAKNDFKKNLPLIRMFINELISRKLIPELNHDLLQILTLDELGVPRAFLSREFQKKKMDEKQRLMVSILRGLLISSDHLASSGLLSVPQTPKFLDCPIVEKEIKACLRPFQKKVSDTMGNAILKAPTGSGKTGAALLWAAKNQYINGRLFYVLPYTASINAMYNRLRNIFPTEAVGILHHKNLAFLYRNMEDDEDQKEESARQRSRLSREIYHPIRVCTPHQILRVALQGKGWEYGITEFRNACFIFDEIHAYDPLITGLTIAAIKWLKSLNSKVIFASATIPKYIEELLKKEIMIDENNILSPDPSIEGDKEICEKIRHKILLRDGNMVEDIDNIVNEIKKDNRKCLLICNHVATGQTVYKKLTEEYGIEATLFHARFNSRDRNNIEKEITSKNPPRVLVATQAIEVSLDINYDIGFIEPAPADAIGQRLGRINRNGTNTCSPAEIVMYTKTYDKNKIYSEDLVNKTVENLRKVSLLTEQQLTNIVNTVYENGYVGEDLENYKRGLNHPIINNFEKEIVAGTHRDWIENIISGSDGIFEVLPNSVVSEYCKLRKQKKFIDAKMLFVPIRTGQKFWTMKKGLLTYNTDLKEYVIFVKYDSKTGLDLKNVDNIW
ncbi:MAG: CRISPR-associated helicase Cas3' [Nanoarchaeota archaeon]